MTVRKWIDRSIAGMEMRSGDYPVTNSEYVAIIVVLSGLENIPRITEIRRSGSNTDPGSPGACRHPSTFRRVQAYENPARYRRSQPHGMVRNSGMI